MFSIQPHIIVIMIIISCYLPCTVPYIVKTIKNIYEWNRIKIYVLKCKRHKKTMFKIISMLTLIKS